MVASLCWGGSLVSEPASFPVGRLPLPGRPLPLSGDEDAISLAFLSLSLSLFLPHIQPSHRSFYSLNISISSSRNQFICFIIVPFFPSFSRAWEIGFLCSISQIIFLFSSFLDQWIYRFGGYFVFMSSSASFDLMYLPIKRPIHLAVFPDSDISQFENLVLSILEF